MSVLAVPSFAPVLSLALVESEPQAEKSAKVAVAVAVKKRRMLDMEKSEKIIET